MSTTRANLLMLIPPLIWGVAFVYQKTGMGSIGPFTFSFARFFFALLTVLPLAILFEKHNLPNGRYGILSLKFRLEPLLCESIKTNLPNLKYTSS